MEADNRARARLWSILARCGAVIFMVLASNLACIHRGHAAESAGEPSGTAAPLPGESCFEVAVGEALFGRLDCLNLKLAELARSRQQHAIELSSGPAAGMAPSALGLFNQYGTQQSLGGNFGHSAIPQRPPLPVYSLPFGPSSRSK